MSVLNEIVGYIGKTGSGKSYFLFYNLIKEIEKRRNVVILDYQPGKKGIGEYSEISNLGVKYLPFGKNTFKIFEQSPDAWFNLIRTYPKIRIHPYGLTYDELEILIDKISEAVFEVGNRLFVIEEAHMFVPNTQNISKNIQRIVTGGRHKGVDLWFAVQKPSLLNTLFLSQMHLAYVFQLTDENCLNRLKTIIGINKEKVFSLGRRKCLIKNFVSGEEGIFNTDGLKVKLEHKG